MIDFNKPMRNIKTGRKLYVQPTWRVAWDGNNYHAVNSMGAMYRLVEYDPADQCAENISETSTHADSGWRPISEYHPSMFKVLIYAKGDIALAFQDTENNLAWTIDDGHDYFPAMRRHLQHPTLFRALPEPPIEKDE